MAASQRGSEMTTREDASESLDAERATCREDDGEPERGGPGEARLQCGRARVDGQGHLRASGVDGRSPDVLHRHGAARDVERRRWRRGGAGPSTSTPSTISRSHRAQDKTIFELLAEFRQGHEKGCERIASTPDEVLTFQMPNPFQGGMSTALDMISRLLRRPRGAAPDGRRAGAAGIGNQTAADTGCLLSHNDIW